MTYRCRHLAPGELAHGALPVGDTDWAVCPDCYVFIRRATQDIYDYLRLHGVRSHA